MVIDKIPGGSGGDHILRNTQTFFIPSHTLDNLFYRNIFIYFTFSCIHAFLHLIKVVLYKTIYKVKPKQFNTHIPDVNMRIHNTKGC